MEVLGCCGVALFVVACCAGGDAKACAGVAPAADADPEVRENPVDGAAGDGAGVAADAPNCAMVLSFLLGKKLELYGCTDKGDCAAEVVSVSVLSSSGISNDSDDSSPSAIITLMLAARIIRPAKGAARQNKAHRAFSPPRIRPPLQSLSKT
jgi:hypothetical protein